MSQQDAWYYATPKGDRIGPISYQELRALIQGRRVFRDDLVWAAHMPEWTPLGQVPELAGWGRQLPPSVPAGASWQGSQDTIDSIKTLELVSAIVWGLIAGMQILVAIGTQNCGSIFLFITGVWNVFAAISRFKMMKMIEKRMKVVVKSYEGISDLVVIGVVNLLIGGIIGALWVIFDFVIRDKVLKNRHLFDQ